MLLDQGEGLGLTETKIQHRVGTGIQLSAAVEAAECSFFFIYSRLRVALVRFEPLSVECELV